MALGCFAAGFVRIGGARSGDGKRRNPSPETPQGLAGGRKTAGSVPRDAARPGGGTENGESVPWDAARPGGGAENGESVPRDAAGPGWGTENGESVPWDAARPGGGTENGGIRPLGRRKACRGDGKQRDPSPGTPRGLAGGRKTAESVPPPTTYQGQAAQSFVIIFLGLR